MKPAATQMKDGDANSGCGEGLSERRYKLVADLGLLRRATEVFQEGKGVPFEVLPRVARHRRGPTTVREAAAHGSSSMEGFRWSINEGEDGYMLRKLWRNSSMA